MKKIKKISTSLLCLNFLLVFVISNFFEYNFNNKFSNKLLGLDPQAELQLEVELELEPELESDSEIKLKSQSKYFNIGFNINFFDLNLAHLRLSNNLLSYLDHITEVPTSPPNNC